MNQTASVSFSQKRLHKDGVNTAAKLPERVIYVCQNIFKYVENMLESKSDLNKKLDLLGRFITSDKPWTVEYNTKSKHQSF